MHILFDQAAHDMRNVGNNALLEAAMSRLRGYWPDATCSVITLAPHLTRMWFPGVVPVDPGTLRPVRRRGDRFRAMVPRFAWSALLEMREQLWNRRFAARGASADSMRAGEDGTQDPPEATRLAGYREAMRAYDLYVASGGGYMCDSDKPRLLDVFDRLESAKAAGIPAVMVGQGVGPLDDPALRARAGQVLPQVDQICVRESRTTLPLLASLGVPADRVLMTGDDAVEMAYHARRTQPRRAIGVSVRVSPYTAVGLAHLRVLRAVLQDAAKARGAELVGVPISSARHERDARRAQEVLDGYSYSRVSWRRLQTPADAIAAAGACRVMVSGTYHGAIFALGQGIPVVGVASSREYLAKLGGLTDEFGLACQVLALDDAGLGGRLTAAIDLAWDTSDAWRPGVLAKVREHLESQCAAYARIRVLVDRDATVNRAT